ncbi:hypothetical protein ANN_23822 [Periplaneta americana]|uniref:Uncharacterized protein n=1 Tax=Periplaneta americana TaxID=6978 RepID=A0ABQ8SN32_PERAM|nr:hypothetical protein ANN_23822 [Periplaneta americana]
MGNTSWPLSSSSSVTRIRIGYDKNNANLARQCEWAERQGEPCWMRTTRIVSFAMLGCAYIVTSKYNDRANICNNDKKAKKGNIEGGGFDPVLWIEFGVAQWSERWLQVYQEDMADVVPGSAYRWHLSAGSAHIQRSHRGFDKRTVVTSAECRQMAPWVDFGTQPPAKLAITRIRDEFEVNGTVHDVLKGRCGRKRSSTDNESVDAVMQAFAESPKNSMRQMFSKLSRATVSSSQASCIGLEPRNPLWFKFSCGRNILMKFRPGMRPVPNQHRDEFGRLTVTREIRLREQAIMAEGSSWLDDRSPLQRDVDVRLGASLSMCSL